MRILGKNKIPKCHSGVIPSGVCQPVIITTARSVHDIFKVTLGPGNPIRSRLKPGVKRLFGMESLR